MMNGGGRSRFPFTASQWQELEHQALVFKYMVSGMPIPPDLLYTIRRSLDSSISSKFLIPQTQPTIGWNSFQMGFGRKIDPEPGRCRRTDGKKWRCSKEAYPDSKYCERHMHRGRNRSRKPVEILSPPTTPATVTTAAVAATPTPQPPNAIPITNNTTSIKTPSPSTSLLHQHQHHPYFTSVAPSSHYPSRTTPQESTTNFFLESNSVHHPHSPGRGACRNGSISGGCSSMSDAWKLAPLTMGSTSSLYQMDQISRHMKNGHHYYNTTSDNIPPPNLEMDNGGNDHQPKKVMHHFLDEWQPPKDKDSCWTNPEDKMPSHRTQLSISIPNSLHDFFMTQKW